MALGAITVISKAQHAGLNHDVVSFNGDSAYAAGGTAGFTALVRTALKKGNVQILYVLADGGAGGKTPVFDGFNDKLKVYNGTSEQGAGDLSGTAFRLVVVSQ